MGIDARDGRVAVEGWTETTANRAIDLVKSLEEKGVAAIVFTDIQRDGMMGGPNIDEHQGTGRGNPDPAHCLRWCNDS